MTSREEPKQRQFTVKQFLIVIAAIAIVLSLIFVWFRRSVTVRAAGPSGDTHKSYFEIDNEKVEIRDVVQASASFRKDTALAAALYSVERGEIRPLSGVVATDNEQSSLLGDELTITCALVSETTTEGAIVKLATAGHCAGVREEQASIVSRLAKHSKTFEGSFSRGRYVVYAEGDSEIILEHSMSLEEFAAKNSGNYLVITIVVHW